ncbi:hypothetical protein Q3G72_004836 [Acer saccharum]|nr:hypothetical protein Q3G72_004836 [Acer saccharum]
MKWDEDSVDGSWLKCCAVGVLKSFSDIQPLIKGLQKIQIQSSSFYLGDKNILWVFNSTRDRDSFIRKKLLWEDFFSSVGLWTKAITPQSRLFWLEFRGVPLHCWCDKFFMRLGWAVGEPLLIEDETRNKELLIRGRVLVLIPFGLKCPGVVKVMTGRSSFSVSVWEDSTPINPAWISWRLGIGDRFVTNLSNLGSDNIDDKKCEEEGHWSVSTNVSVFKKGGLLALKSSTNTRNDELENGMEKVNSSNTTRAKGSGVDNFGKENVGFQIRPNGVNEGPKIVDKGKGNLFKRWPSKPYGPSINKGNIILEKNLQDARVEDSEESGSSSSEEREGSIHSPILRGETSTGGLNQIDKEGNVETQLHGDKDDQQLKEVVAGPINLFQAEVVTGLINSPQVRDTSLGNSVSQVSETSILLQSAEEVDSSKRVRRSRLKNVAKNSRSEKRLRMKTNKKNQFYCRMLGDLPVEV